MNWENPYKLKLDQFPGRLFTADDIERDLAMIHEHLRRSTRTIVELGSGSGLHLIEAARREPSAAVFGFEIRFKRAVRTLEKAQARGVENCFVIRTSYDRMVEFFPPNSIDCLYINFPDPWAKKRQRKHRILGQKLFHVAPTLLQDDGSISVKTDHQEYFQTFCDELAADPRFRIVAKTEDLYRSDLRADSIPTEFEQLFVRQGLPIYHLIFAKAAVI